MNQPQAAIVSAANASIQLHRAADYLNYITWIVWHKRFGTPAGESGTLARPVWHDLGMIACYARHSSQIKHRQLQFWL